MKNRKRIATFPTNHTHKVLDSLNNQTFYGAGSLTLFDSYSKYINFLDSGNKRGLI